jgi:hypothetical protein
MATKTKGTKQVQAQRADAAKTLNAVKDLDAAKVIADVGELQLTVQNALAGIGGNIASKLTQLKQVEEAIGLKEARLKELHQIDTASITLDQIQADIEAAREAFQKQEEDREKEVEKSEEQRNREWDRKNEDLEYAFSKKKREKDEYLFNTEAAKHAHWDQREKELKAREIELADLKALAASFESRLKNEIAKETANVTNSLKKQYDHEKQLLHKDAEVAAKVAESNLKAKDDSIASLSGRISELTSQLATARQDAKEVATKALESASGRQVVDALERAAVSNGRNEAGKK